MNTSGEQTGEFVPEITNKTDVNRIFFHDERFQQWLEERQRYMENRGWHEGDDRDLYDINPNTAHLVVDNHEQQLVMGMRITPIDSFEDALSFDMFGQNQQLQETAREAWPFPSTMRIWDITRLVPGEITEQSPRLGLKAIARLFGKGLDIGQASGDENPVWVFTIDEYMVKFLRSQHLDVVELARGRITQDDLVDIIFGYALPKRIAEDTKGETFREIAIDQHPLGGVI